MGTEEAVKKYAEKSEKLGEHVTAYLLPFQDVEEYENRGLTREQVLRKKGKASNKSEEEIQKEIDRSYECSKLFGSSSNWSKVITSKEGTYCHLFVRDTLSRPTMFTLNGIPFPEPLRAEYHYIYELTARTSVKIVEEGKSNLGKRKTPAKWGRSLHQSWIMINPLL